MKRNSGGASPVLNFDLPDECRKAAETLFPSGGPSPAPDLDAMAGFAKALGIGADYGRLLRAGRGADEMRKFLGHFQNNFDLLIQKTWVEKNDEERKENLLDKLSPFMALLERGDFPLALREFGSILDELAYLLFGAQSGREDFTEYAFRIDIEMGLFWWYAANLREMKTVGADAGDALWALLLIGLCYLTNF